MPTSLGLAGNKVLLSRVAGLAEDAAIGRVEGEATKVRRYGEFAYAAKTWSAERRMIARVEASDRGSDSRFIVTNLTGTPQWLIWGIARQPRRADLVTWLVFTFCPYLQVVADPFYGHFTLI